MFHNSKRIPCVFASFWARYLLWPWLIYPQLPVGSSMVYPTQPPMLLTGDGCLTHVIQFLAAKYGSDRKLKVINLTSSKAQHEAYWNLDLNSRGWSLKSEDPVGGVGTDFFRMSDLPAQTFSSAAASERSEREASFCQCCPRPLLLRFRLFFSGGRTRTNDTPGCARVY